MAPRRCHAASSAGAAGVSLASLPDVLLERIMGLLDQRDRHCAALVSRCWHAAAHTPAALQIIRLNCINNRQAEARLPSFTAWLQRHGRHVCSLDLHCKFITADAQLCTWELSACLAACAAAGALQKLNLDFDGVVNIALCVTSWCAALRQLRQLDITGDGPVRISSSLDALTELTQLVLSGTAVSLDAPALLPPNVERLRLWDETHTVLPHQLSGLTRLSTLELRTTACEPGGYGVLTSLGRLAQLEFCDNHLPTCLPQLTGLVELKLFKAGSAMHPAAARAALNGALQQLTGLTSLCIHDERKRYQPLPAIGELSRLQRCCLGRVYDESFFNEQGATTPLPAGPWAASLRELGASMYVLARSTEVLAAATQLTRLALRGSTMGCDGQEAFWEWAGSHPSLRRLQIESEMDARLSFATLHKICSLIRERPDVEVCTSKIDLVALFQHECSMKFG